MRRRRQLSTRILASVVTILLASSLVGFALVTLRQRAEFEHDYQQRALAVAQTFATTPSLRTPYEPGSQPLAMIGARR
jgi:two-component system, CitB family, sensor kinase